MSESAEIAKLSPRHDVILAYLIANPTEKKADVARAFGVTPAWFSTIINSDIFQAKMAERQDEFFSIAVTPIKEKLAALADLTLDRLIETAEVDTRSDSLRASAELALKALGYGRETAPSLPSSQHVHLYACDPDLLAQARGRIFNREVVSGPNAIGSDEIATAEL